MTYCENVIYADDGAFTEQEGSDCTQESQTFKLNIENPALLRAVASLLFCKLWIPIARSSRFHTGSEAGGVLVFAPSLTLVFTQLHWAESHWFSVRSSLRGLLCKMLRLSSSQFEHNCRCLNAPISIKF
jgi:hypothetical protein